MRATILSIIRKGPKNSRYLVLTENNEYGSLVAANEKYHLGDNTKIEETIDSNVKDSWLNTYYNWANIKQNVLTHLAKYKKEKLGIEVNGVWSNQDGEEIEYQHILYIVFKFFWMSIFWRIKKKYRYPFTWTSHILYSNSYSLLKSTLLTMILDNLLGIL